jgi:hypothetical protein
MLKINSSEKNSPRNIPKSVKNSEGTFRNGKPLHEALYDLHKEKQNKPPL